MKWPLCLTVCAGVLALATQHQISDHPLLVWNATESVPIGLYRVIRGDLRHGALAVVQLPHPTKAYAHARGYLPASVFLIKPIAALQGDTFCRLGALVLVNGRAIARSHALDGFGRSLPQWQGCHRLNATTLAVISRRADSFDSRYFGLLERHQVIGVAVPLWAPTRP